VKPKYQSFQAILKYLVLGELKIKYKSRLLGVLWALIDPLMLMLIYLVLVKFIFQRGGPTYAVELLTGLIAYRWFSTSVIQASRSLVANGKLLQTVKFPYSVIPISKVLINGVDMLVGFVILFPLLFFFEVTPTMNWIWLPFLLMIEFQFVIASALVVSIIGVYFRDILNILQFGLRILLYLSPVLYGIDQIPSQYQVYYQVFSPLSPLIDSYKRVMIYGVSPSNYMLVFAALSVLTWFLAVYQFKSRKNLAKDL
jgi:lipopolysaccharide transport system permease protein